MAQVEVVEADGQKWGKDGRRLRLKDGILQVMNTDRCSKEHYHATRARPHKRGLAHAQIYNPGQD